MLAPRLQGNLQARLSQMIVKGKFSIKKLYLAILPDLLKVTWKSIILNTSIYPRHRFILRLALLKRLAKVDRLAKFEITIDTSYVFCHNVVETHNHLCF